MRRNPSTVVLYVDCLSETGAEGIKPADDRRAVGMSELQGVAPKAEILLPDSFIKQEL